MSLECGVVLAHLTGRVLALDGNGSPAANLIEGRLVGDRLGADAAPARARVTDLVEMPAEWIDVAERPDWSAGLAEPETWTSDPLYACLFYLPPDLDTASPDLAAFANGRAPERFLTRDELHAAVPVLALPSPLNLAFYSYLLYLPPSERRGVHRLLARMRPRAPYRELAERIVRRLGGEFNAVHVRLGDFRETLGVTTRMRTPEHVLDALRPHFSPRHRLLICTDEPDLAEFFDPIRAAYRDSVLFDPFVLGDPELREAFLDLPFHDDMAMAYLTQLVAAESRDFVGSMTSTFTSMIQRLRGNRGRNEDFKFLWCEIPDPGDALARGAHRFATGIPFEGSRLVEQREGPYSWNRLDLWVGPEYYAWFREWPEAFLEPSDARSG